MIQCLFQIGRFNVSFQCFNVLLHHSGYKSILQKGSTFKPFRPISGSKVAVCYGEDNCSNIFMWIDGRPKNGIDMGKINYIHATLK